MDLSRATYLPSPVDNEKCVAMCIFKDRLYLATERTVYVKDDKDNFHQLSFVEYEESNRAITQEEHEALHQESLHEGN